MGRRDWGIKDVEKVLEIHPVHRASNLHGCAMTSAQIDVALRHPKGWDVVQTVRQHRLSGLHLACMSDAQLRALHIDLSLVLRWVLRWNISCKTIMWLFRLGVPMDEPMPEDPVKDIRTPENRIHDGETPRQALLRLKGEVVGCDRMVGSKAGIRKTIRVLRRNGDLDAHGTIPFQPRAPGALTKPARRALTSATSTGHVDGAGGVAEIKPKLVLMDAGHPGGRVSLCGGCWLQVSTAPDDIVTYGHTSFDKLFDTHPEEKGMILIDNTQHPAHRWYASYLSTPPRDVDRMSHSYMFSADGSVDNAPLPDVWKPFLEALNRDRGSNGQHTYNQVVINWYEDGDDYIPMHCDCDVDMPEGADIAVLTLCDTEETATRTFVLQSRGSDLVGEDGIGRVEIATTHGRTITLGGRTNALYRHGVPRVIRGPARQGRRISMSFRTFNITKSTTSN